MGGKKRIIFRTEGHRILGMGHIYNCLTMAEAIGDENILFLVSQRSDFGIKKLKEKGCVFKVIRSDNSLAEIIESFQPDIWVNDCLNTSEEYIKYLKRKINRVVTIEDKGDGAKYADATINAMYEEDNDRDNSYYGWRYACLRDEFQKTPPNCYREIVKKVIIMFGGTDPSNYNRLLYNILINISKNYDGIEFDFITGIGYDAEENGVITIPEKNVYIYNNASRITDFMVGADIAIASQGRAVFELAAMAIPSIILSQNEREQTHSFAQMDHGFLNLGLRDVNEALVGNTLTWLINTPPIRRNMYDLMINIPLRDGLERVKRIVLGEYE